MIFFNKVISFFIYIHFFSVSYQSSQYCALKIMNLVLSLCNKT